MSIIVKSITELVGNTPLMEFVNYEKANNLNATIYGKLDYFNPTGSIKDRAALSMILKAEEEGKIRPGDTIVENTSGNTGIGLAAFAAAKGYKLEVFLEPGQSVERQTMLKAYGAVLHFYTDLPVVAEAIANGTLNFRILLDEIEKYCASKTDGNYYFINQVGNEANPYAHYTTTGPEIWEATEGDVDILVALVGTAGTINGVSRYLKEKNPNLKVYAAQPALVSRPSAENPTPNTIDGVVFFKEMEKQNWPVFIQDIPFDECFDVVAEDAYAVGKQLAKTDGVFLGQSAAAALWVATELAKRPENVGKKIVAMMADNGMKYLSTNMYKED